jgi:hypothetical protein
MREARCLGTMALAAAKAHGRRRTPLACGRLPTDIREEARLEEDPALSGAFGGWRVRPLQARKSLVGDPADHLERSFIAMLANPLE